MVRSPKNKDKHSGKTYIAAKSDNLKSQDNLQLNAAAKTATILTVAESESCLAKNTCNSDRSNMDSSVAREQQIFKLENFATNVDIAGGSGTSAENNGDVIMWNPSPMMADLRDDSYAVCRFAKIVEAKYNRKFSSYHDLHRWSVEHYDQFWYEVWSFCGVISANLFSQVVDMSKRIDEVPEWFHGATLNYAENLLMRSDDNKIAIYATSEASGSDINSITFRQLKEQVAKYAAALKKCGVVKGDRVAGCMPNSIECVVAMLATAALGAVWSSTSLDFGVTAVLDRLTQIKPKILFSVEATIYNNKRHPNLVKLDQISRQLPSLEKLVLIGYLKEKLHVNTEAIHKCILLEDFLKLPIPQGIGKLQFEHVPFNHPLFIMFSSGTTGPPKCMVHSVGGTLLKHLEEHVIQHNLTNNDILFFYTTVGWMMWNWLVSALAAGSAIVLYDGSPFAPHEDVLFNIASVLEVTAMGMGAKCYAVCQSNNLDPTKDNDLSSLKILFSTGSPLKPQLYDYIYNKIKRDVLVASISGGTDIIACFVASTWTLPVVRGQIQCPVLGCKIESWNALGQFNLDEPGELVCCNPFPSMPVYFLDDEDGLKYKHAYFCKFPGVWAHGDYCIIDGKTGGIVMLGRSDNTLNPGGVRFGSAEIYHVVESFADVEDSVCVSQKIGYDGLDERVVLFVKMKQQQPQQQSVAKAPRKFDANFEMELRAAIRSQLSAKHVPEIILPVEDIPYTTSGKKVEMAVKKAIGGEKLANTDHLANPECLRFYYNIPELQF